MITYVLRFDDANATDAAIVGGKAANLGRLTQAGFHVPQGVTVCTNGYTDFMAENGLFDAVERILSNIRFDDPRDLEVRADEIRATLLRGRMPAAIQTEIVNAYRSLGDEAFVAVRSSGTAEDLAQASFAGQHDTYLDIRGDDSVVDAVKRCWASMWTSRAIAYRRQNQLDQKSLSIAVVIQTMIVSEVAGVIFTANPINGAVDEMVVNAAWGLGESVVSGVVNPDQFVLKRDSLNLQSVQIGEKALRIVRSSGAKAGTVELKVPAEQAAAPTLNADQLRQLGQLGRAVQGYYEGYPQDIEWAYAEGQFYLLQSRSITGVALSWDEDLDDYESCSPEAPDTVWTRAWGDAIWPDGVTPLFYSVRAEMVADLHTTLENIWGFHDVAKMRVLKYHKGRVYYNSRIDYTNIARTLPPNYRTPDLLLNIPDEWKRNIAKEDWSIATPIKMILRIAMLLPDAGPYRVLTSTYEKMKGETKDADGLDPADIRLLSDRELKRYVNSRLKKQAEWVGSFWTSFFVYLPLAMSILNDMVKRWYDGDNPLIASDLITGLDQPTITMRENELLYDLAQLIRRKPALSSLFQEHEGRAFFDAVKTRPEGAEFREAYDRFLVEFGHRGHGDRDIYADRRSENPAIDYANLRALLTADSRSRGDASENLIARRKAATTDFIQSLERHPPLASLKVELFRTVQSWLLKFFAMRDDQRHYTDRITFSKKRALCEVGHRLQERAVLSGDDFYFLSKEELFELLDLGKPTRVTREKIAARRANYKLVESGTKGPMYIRNGKYVDLDTPASSREQSGNVLRGTGTSRGEVVGIARIVVSQKGIGEVRKGEILVTSATDPGWTSVFLVISGLVLETGGMLAHGACISREYGIPAVQISNAMSLIKDGALISVNGEKGEVRILAEPADAARGDARNAYSSKAPAIVS